MSQKRVVFLNGPMGADNILHLLAGYNACSYCQGMIVSWLMDRPEVCAALEGGAQAAGLETVWFTLRCTRQALTSRWLKDSACPWRMEENLRASIRSLEAFSKLPGIVIDTANRTAEQVRDSILDHLAKGV